jgi:hypothetical protein
MDKRQLLITSVVAMLALTVPITAQAELARGNKLPVVGTSDPAPAQSKMAIWVGEVDLLGKKRLWVELIDEYGEVVYDSEVQPNETHILPDGSAIDVRRSIDGQFMVSKPITDRVPNNVRFVRTRRVVSNADGVTTVEFLKSDPKPTSQPDSELMSRSNAGRRIWLAFVAFFTATADSIRTAWHSVLEVFVA